MPRSLHLLCNYIHLPFPISFWFVELSDFKTQFTISFTGTLESCQKQDLLESDGFKSWLCHSVAEECWECSLVFLNLSSLLYKIGNRTFYISLFLGTNEAINKKPLVQCLEQSKGPKNSEQL